VECIRSLLDVSALLFWMQCGGLLRYHICPAPTPTDTPPISFPTTRRRTFSKVSVDVNCKILCTLASVLCFAKPRICKLHIRPPGHHHGLHSTPRTPKDTPELAKIDLTRGRTWNLLIGMNQVRILVVIVVKRLAIGPLGQIFSD
jgi:hypothetical protein